MACYYNSFHECDTKNIIAKCMNIVDNVEGSFYMGLKDCGPNVQLYCGPDQRVGRV